MKLGIDFGNTIVYKLSHHDEQQLFPNAIRVINMLTKRYEVHIISKVNDRQKAEVSDWIERFRFCEVTGIPSENIHFCAERAEKANICSKLGITTHIDDRVEVLKYLNSAICGILFRPKPEEVIEYFESIRYKSFSIVQSWKEVEEILL